MTLYDLLTSTTVQGDIRLSTWQNGEEVIIYQTGEYGTDNFSICYVNEKYWYCEVEYIFCPGDNFLHIEIKTED